MCSYMSSLSFMTTRLTLLKKVSDAHTHTHLNTRIVPREGGVQQQPFEACPQYLPQ